MKILCENFGEGERIPSEYTCDGENVSPEIGWTDVTDGTRSFALIMDDPDIPEFVKEKLGIVKFDHWVLYNIPADCSVITRGGSAGVVGLTSRGEAKYHGPCPPDREHRYFFKLYALDAMLDLAQGAKAVELEQAMSGHILDSAVLMARYERTN